MINLFYEESYWMGTNRMTGPRAVVRNLLASLEDQKIPYAVNQEKYDHNFIVQYDRNGYIKHSKLTLENCTIGPQVWFFDEHVKELQQHPERYKSIIVPSQWTKDLAINKFGFERVETWPVGIPLPEIKRDDDVHQFDCMIYSKRRSVQELNTVVDLLQKKKMSFRTLVYGNYNQEELALMCSRAKFCFLLNGTESQGMYQNGMIWALGIQYLQLPFHIGLMNVVKCLDPLILLLITFLWRRHLISFVVK